MKKSGAHGLKGVIVFSQIAFTVIIIVGGFILLAHKCMQWFGWGQWCLALGAILGTLSSIYYMFMQIYIMIKREENKDA